MKMLKRSHFMLRPVVFTLLAMINQCSMGSLNILGSAKIIVICLHWMYSHATVTFENVFRLAYETSSSVLK